MRSESIDGIDLGGSMTRMLGATLKRGSLEMARKIFVMEINRLENPAALRTDSEHRYFRKRARVMRALAMRKGFTMHETENGRVY